MKEEVPQVLDVSSVAAEKIGEELEQKLISGIGPENHTILRFNTMYSEGKTRLDARDRIKLLFSEISM